MAGGAAHEGTAWRDEAAELDAQALLLAVGTEEGVAAALDGVSVAGLAAFRAVLGEADMTALNARIGDTLSYRLQPEEGTLAAALHGQAAITKAGDQVSDAISQVVVLLLGAGPAIAAYQGLLSSQAANGRMFEQAVADQQRMNMLAMCMTAKCVRYMLDGDAEDWTEEAAEERLSEA